MLVNTVIFIYQKLGLIFHFQDRHEKMGMNYPQINCNKLRLVRLEFLLKAVLCSNNLPIRAMKRSLKKNPYVKWFSILYIFNYFNSWPLVLSCSSSNLLCTELVWVFLNAGFWVSHVTDCSLDPPSLNLLTFFPHPRWHWVHQTIFLCLLPCRQNLCSLFFTFYCSLNCPTH